MMPTALIYGAQFLEHDTGLGHPENYHRLTVILESLQKDSLLWHKLRHYTPRPATTEDLLRCHDHQLIISNQQACAQNIHYLDADTAICPASYNVAVLAAGAGLTAVDLLYNNEASNAFALIRPPGHHATSNEAMGFCLFNNIAISARYAQAKYGIKKILIIDWDVHHGNGTQQIFYDDPSVFYFSTHQFPFYPGDGAAHEKGVGKGIGANLNIPLAAGTPAALQIQLFTEELHQLTKQFQPNLILISAGFDAHKADPLANLSLCNSDYAEMTRTVMEIADKYTQGKIISFLEGGYNLAILGDAVKAHIKTLANK